jgi:hypothetical protein
VRCARSATALVRPMVTRAGGRTGRRAKVASAARSATHLHEPVHARPARNRRGAAAQLAYAVVMSASSSSWLSSSPSPKRAHMRPLGIARAHRCAEPARSSRLDTSPMRTRCQALRAANAQIIEQLGDDLRPGVDSLQFARLVGGIASVVDQGNLPAASVAPMLEVVVDGLLV